MVTASLRENASCLIDLIEPSEFRLKKEAAASDIER